MEKGKSLKKMSWTKKDVFLVVLTYVLNFLILDALLLLKVLLNGKSVGDYLTEQSSFLNFSVLLLISVSFMSIYFFFEDRNFLKNAGNSEMIFLIMEFALIACFGTEMISIYLRPLALAAILTIFLTNSRTAIFVNSVYCVVNFLYDSLSEGFVGFEGYSGVFFLIMGLASGVVAIYCVKDVYSRIKLLLLGFLFSIPVLICVALPQIDFGGGEMVIALVAGVFSGPLSVILGIILLPLFETLFKKVTSFKLSELTSHKSKYVRKLIEQAPGTFNHAIIVSNIAEACAISIEEDSLLARTCAYYHDIGKLRRPEFFKENQVDGENLHDDLAPELSANIIKAHATDGYQLANKSRLPKIIADVCKEHHGTLPILFFYDKAKRLTDGEVSIAQYCYPGPKPQTKMAAIIMIADGCEAVSRALKDRSRENVTEAVKKIVNDRMNLGQFDECDITLKELDIIINTVVNSLTGIYHKRIEYPKMDIKDIENFDKIENKN